MFTRIDKALVGVVMGALYILNYFFGLDFGFTEAGVASVIAVITPVLIYLVPNKDA